MAITSCIQPNFIVDSESERDPNWPNYCLVFCKDTNKTYVLKDGTFILATPNGLVGFNKITVGTTQPESPSVGDLWVEIS